MPRGFIGYGIALFLTGTLFCSAVAEAEIRQFSATVESDVQEFIGPSPSDSDYAFDSFPGVSTSNLPMQTNAGFTRYDSADTIVAEGRAITTFSDPRLSELPSPEEFGISSIAYATDPQLSHQSRCKTTETREIVFTGADTALAEGTAIRVRSQFFLDGIVVLWNDAGVSGLGGVTATFHVEVVQDRPATGTATVLSTDVTLIGTSNDGSELETAGVIGEGNLVRLDLNGAVSGLNAVQAVLIPDIAIPYEYDATVGESFTLKAAIDAVVTNKPGGRGVAIVLGAPLQELAGLVNRVSGLGDTFTGSLNIASETAPPPSVPLPRAKGIEITALSDAYEDPFGFDGRIIRPFCGAMGIEIPAMTAIFGTMTLLSRRRAM